jgi:hypothetical protein
VFDDAVCFGDAFASVGGRVVSVVSRVEDEEWFRR